MLGYVRHARATRTVSTTCSARSTVLVHDLGAQSTFAATSWGVARRYPTCAARPARARARRRRRLHGLAGATTICAVTFRRSISASCPDPSNSYNDRSTMIKVAEYMAVGKPLVAFDLPEHRVTAGDAALYATPNDERDFAQKLEELIAAPELRASMGIYAIERVHGPPRMALLGRLVARGVREARSQRRCRARRARLSRQVLIRRATPASSAGRS